MTHDSKNKKITPRSLEVRKSLNLVQHTGRWKRVIDPLRRNSPLITISAFVLVAAGLFQTICAIAGGFQSLWTASIATIAGGVCTLIGFFMFYEIFHQRDVRHDLFRESIRRVIDHQN